MTESALPPSPTQRPALVVLSARTPELLARDARAMAATLEADPGVPVPDVGRTLAHRNLLEARLAVVAGGRTELLDRLRLAADALATGRTGRLTEGAYAEARPCNRLPVDPPSPVPGRATGRRALRATWPAPSLRTGWSSSDSTA